MLVEIVNTSTKCILAYPTLPISGQCLYFSVGVLFSSNFINIGKFVHDVTRASIRSRLLPCLQLKRYNITCLSQIIHLDRCEKMDENGDVDGVMV